MKKLKLKRLTLDELAEVMPVVKKEEQQGCVGGGGGDPYSWGYQDSTNCVAYALAGLGANFDSAKYYINNRYGSNGVPAYAMDSVIRYFFPNSTQVSRSYFSGSMANTFIWYQTSDSTGHAVNGFWNSGGTILYTDPQNRSSGVISATDSCNIYKVR